MPATPMPAYTCQANAHSAETTTPAKNAKAVQYLPEALPSGRSKSSVICSGVFAAMPGILLQIRDLRHRSQLAEEFRTPITARQARDFAIGVAQIAEYHRLRRAGLHAGGLDFAVLHRALFRFRLNFSGLDALHAERALFHHDHFAQRNIGIQLKV